MADTFCKIIVSCTGLPIRSLLDGSKRAGNIKNGLEKKEINVRPYKNGDRDKSPRSVTVLTLVIIFATFLYATRLSTVQFWEEPFHVLGSDCQCSINGFTFIVGDRRLCFGHDSRKPIAQGVPRCTTKLQDNETMTSESKQVNYLSKYQHLLHPWIYHSIWIGRVSEEKSRQHMDKQTTLHDKHEIYN
jgi:hypothetical protein